MLNNAQVQKLNEIFEKEIVPVFEENPEAVEFFMSKVRRHQKNLNGKIETGFEARFMSPEQVKDRKRRVRAFIDDFFDE